MYIIYINTIYIPNYILHYRQINDETIHANEACKTWLQSVGESRFCHGLFLYINDVYIGRPSDGTTTEVGLGEQVVLQLSESLRGGNYQIYSDNYFTTCHLLDTLHTHHLYGCGTTRNNRRGYPNTLKDLRMEI